MCWIRSGPIFVLSFFLVPEMLFPRHSIKMPVAGGGDHRTHANRARRRQSNPDGQDLFLLQWRLLAEQLALVPRDCGRRRFTGSGASAECITVGSPSGTLMSQPLQRDG